MARQFAWIFLIGFLGSAGASAAPLCEQQRGDAEPSRTRPGRTRGRPAGSGGCTPTAARNSASRDQQSKKIDEVWESTAPKQREKWHELEKLEEALAKTIKENTADVAIVAQQVEKVEKLRAENNTTPGR